MIRYYCDGCDEELTPKHLGRRNDTGRLYADIDVLRGKSLHVEVFTGMGHASAADRVGVTHNDGNWCANCIAKALLVAVSAGAQGQETP